ncbi:hypothetical protein EBU58_13495 [bacterium]|nr:hypothetical protein [bacterium]
MMSFSVDAVTPELEQLVQDDEAVAVAYQETRETAHAKDTDLRTAAFINAINKVAVTYSEMGIFP